MKKLLLLVLITGFINCDKIDRLFTHFEIQNESEFTVASTTIINSPISFDTPDVTTNSSSEFSNNNTNADLVESVKLKSLILSIISPSDADFNFLKSVRIYISADGLEEVELANLEDIENDNLSILNMNTTGVELREYVKRDSYSLRVSTITDETIAQDHQIKANAIFNVDAEILGI
jgi:hypothetical protein